MARGLSDDNGLLAHCGTGPARRAALVGSRRPPWRLPCVRLSPTGWGGAVQGGAGRGGAGRGGAGRGGRGTHSGECGGVKNAGCRQS